MMRRRSLLRIDDSNSRRRRVALRQRTSISARAGSPYGVRLNDQQLRAPTLPESRQGDPKQSIPKTEGRPFCGSIKNGQLLAKGEDFRHQFQTRRKERACKGKEKREESHKREARARNLDTQGRQVVLRYRSRKCKHPKVGWDFRYLQVPKNSYSALEPMANLIINSNCYGTKTCYTASSDGNFVYASSFL